MHLTNNTLQTQITQKMSFSTMQFEDGHYGRGKVIGKWGRQRNVPTTCGHSVSTRGNAPCQYVPTWYRGGYGWSCGQHRNVVKPNDLPPPPPPVEDETAPFVPFECSICISDCCQKDDSVTTICNHRFHKGCLEKWSYSGRSQVACPLCRTILPRNVARNLMPSFNNQTTSIFEQILERLANIDSSLTTTVGRYAQQ